MANSQDPNVGGGGGGNDPRPTPAPKPTTGPVILHPSEPPKKPAGSSQFGISPRGVGKVVLRGILIFFALLGVVASGVILFGKLPQQQSTTTAAPAIGPVEWQKVTIKRELDGWTTYKVEGMEKKEPGSIFSEIDPSRAFRIQKPGQSQTKPVQVPQTKNEPTAEPPKKPTAVEKQPSVEGGPSPKPAKAKVAPAAEEAVPLAEQPKKPKQPKKEETQKVIPNPCTKGHQHHFYPEGEWCPERQCWVTRQSLSQGRDIRYRGNGMR